MEIGRTTGTHRRNWGWPPDLRKTTTIGRLGFEAGGSYRDLRDSRKAGQGVVGVGELKHVRRGEWGLLPQRWQPAGAAAAELSSERARWTQCSVSLQRRCNQPMDASDGGELRRYLNEAKQHGREGAGGEAGNLQKRCNRPTEASKGGELP